MKTASDLATEVQKELVHRGLTSPPQLLQLLETLYLASLATEEGVSTRVQVAYANPSTGNAAPQGSIIDEMREHFGFGRDRWRCVPFFSGALPVNPGTVVKLAAGTDPRSSLLLVYEFEGQNRIWGLADMQDEFARFMKHETYADRKPDRPGVFQIHVEGVGHLKVFVGFERIAELSGGELLPAPIDVLSEGPIFAALRPAIAKIYQGLQQPKLSKLVSREEVERTFLSTIYQLLIRVENLHHGGALLFTSSGSTEGLHIANAIQYIRLLEGVAMDAMGRATAATMMALNVQLFESGQDLPAHLWTEEKRRWVQMEEAKQSLNGAIWFVASLTKIDGLVLLDQSLVVNGFGVVLKQTDLPAGIKAYQAMGADPRKSLVRPLRLEGFGTRHRSMAAYCARNPGSLGFVISKDGGVRAFMCIGKRLMMWDNVMLHQSPASQTEMKKGEAALRSCAEEAIEIERKLNESGNPPKSDEKSRKFKQFVDQYYPRFFRSSGKK